MFKNLLILLEMISDISIYQSGYPIQQFQEDNKQCLANYTVVSASIIDGNATKGITCSRKDSTAIGTWTHSADQHEIKCDEGQVRCIKESGSVTLYTVEPSKGITETIYTCCIDGLCTSIRLWQFSTITKTYPYSECCD